MSLFDECELVEVGAHRTRVRIEGDPAGPPVLLLHGLGRSLEDWRVTAAVLAPAHRVIRMDLPGFGLSPRPVAMADLASLVRGVQETLDVLGLHEPLHVAGNSLGGAVAAQLLVTAPERVRSLILVDPAGFGAEVTVLLRLLTVPGIGWLATRRTARAGARMLSSRIFADRSLVTAEEVDRAVALGNQVGAGDFLVAMAAGLGTWRGVRPDWRARLAEGLAASPRPTLLVWGEQDRVLPISHLQEALRVLPHAEVVRYPRTGHAPQIERAEEFAARVVDFIASTEGTTGRAVPGTRIR